MKLLPIKNGEGIKCIPKEGRLVSNYFLFHQLSVFFVLKRQKKDLEISLSPWKLLASSRGFEPLLTAWKAAVLGRLDDEDVCREVSFMQIYKPCQMFFTEKRKKFKIFLFLYRLFNIIYFYFNKLYFINIFHASNKFSFL